MCRTPLGRSQPPSPAGIRAFPAFLLPIVLQEGGSAATQGPAGDWVRVNNSQVQSEIQSPIPCVQQNVSWAASVFGEVHVAVMGTSGLGKDLSAKGLCAEVPIPKSRFLG